MIQKIKDSEVYVRLYDLAIQIVGTAKAEIEGLSSRLKKRLLIVFFLLSILQPITSTISQAQNLDEFLQLAGENNPELKAYFSDYLAAMEKVPQVGALPDPELTMGLFLRPMERFMGNQQADIQLMQMFPWFGTLKVQKDEASKMALARYAVFQDAKNRLFYDVKNTWYQMYRLEEEIRISEENLKILQTYERLAIIRYQSAGGIGEIPDKMPGGNSATNIQETSSGSSMENMGGGIKIGKSSGPSGSGNVPPGMVPSATMGSGKTGMTDVLRVRIELKELENKLEYLRDSRKILAAEFNQWLNRDADEAIAMADALSESALSIDQHALFDSLSTNNPMLKMLDAEGEAYEAQVKMAKLMGRPMLGAGLSYMAFSPRPESGMTMGGNDMLMPMVSLSIPIYRKKNKAMVREAELKQQSVQQRRENTVNQLNTQWAAALRDWEDAIRRTGLYKEQASLAQQTLTLLMTGYSSNGQNFEDILRVHQQLLDYQLKGVSVMVDQHMAVAMLEMLAGDAVLME